MKSLTLLFTLLFFSKSFCQTDEKLAYHNRDKYMFSVSTVSVNFTNTIEFNYHKQLIIVPVQINGRIFRFLYDTGAISAVSEEIKNELKLQLSFTNNLIDGSGIIQTQGYYNLNNLKLGDVVFTNIGVGSFDFKHLSQGIGMDIDGILGSNIIRTLNWKIDYMARTLTLSDRKLRADTKSNKVEFKENFSGSPVLNSALGEFTFELQVDTGNNMAFNLPDSLFFKSYKSKTHKLDVESNSKFFSLYSTEDEKVKNNNFTGIIDSIYIDKKLFKNQSIRVNPIPLPMVGNKFLEQFGKVIIDYSRRRILLPKKIIRPTAY